MAEASGGRLQIEHLRKVYGKKTALDDFSVSADRGIYGILGANGAGKTTLMSLLTDNAKRDGGSILWEGREILELGEAYRRQVGYMPQEQICYPQFYAREFLEYMAVLKGLRVKEPGVRKHIDELLEKVHLKEVQNDRVGSFSGGMKRRLLLAQAMLGEPNLIILDEPTAGLDPRERIAMRNMIVELARDRVILLATHIAADIECVANSVIIIKDGKVLRNAPPAVLMQEVLPHVREIFCANEEIPEYQRRFKVGNIMQRNDGCLLHVIERENGELPKPATVVTMDDVYLYYCEP
ncbi:MAG: ATP-binding cassette domain-containing protein [Firmicutes bacterium]|nr:ATP-binding cassette domain-containing protein [Bacillota bacterium]